MKRWRRSPPERSTPLFSSRDRDCGRRSDALATSTSLPSVAAAPEMRVLAKNAPLNAVATASTAAPAGGPVPAAAAAVSSGTSHRGPRQIVYDDDDSDVEEGLLEVTVPHGTRAGDTVQVRVPQSAGGGIRIVTVPTGYDEGETFEIQL